mmetsp:Transcript_32104/g.67310  ORF Transcript_32104/g.67310 Transcript_32104/m.67310 type:complete len:226 (+) Transcript_32104:1038-1715(+)
MLHSVLVHRVGHENDLDVLGDKLLNRWRFHEALLVLARDVVNVLLVLLHVGDILLEADLLVARFGRGVAEQLRKAGAIRGILNQPHLDVLAKCFPKLDVLALLVALLFRILVGLLHLRGFLFAVLLLGVLFLVRICQSLDHRQGLASHLLPDHLEHLVLLEHLTRNVERERIRVDDALDEAQVTRQKLIELVSDHHATHVELQVALLLVVVLVQVVRRLLGNVQD